MYYAKDLLFRKCRSSLPEKIPLLIEEFLYRFIYFGIALTIYPLGKWITLTFMAIKDIIYLPQGNKIQIAKVMEIVDYH